LTDKEFVKGRGIISIKQAGVKKLGFKKKEHRGG